ncbi:MAG: DMT family transporter [Sorangiineae bacterium]|nr:DMT family transporter [Polyangiaceae bacterium]MEB2323609.1 DMT family transporter [Sorangiineae bacterium]
MHIIPAHDGAAPRATQAVAWQQDAGTQSASLSQASVPLTGCPGAGCRGRGPACRGGDAGDAGVVAAGGGLAGITTPGRPAGAASGPHAAASTSEVPMTASLPSIRGACTRWASRARFGAGAPSVIRLFALVGVVGISFSAVFVRLAHVSPSTSAFYRGAYAVPILFVWWLLVRRRDRRSRWLRSLAFVAGTFLALDLTLWHRSIDDIGAGLSTVLTNTQIAFVGLLAWAVHKERPTRAALVMIPFVIAGVVLISGMGRADAYGSEPLRGALLGALSGLAYAGFLLIFRRANRVLSHPAGPMLDATLGMTVGALAGSVFDPRFSLAFVWPAHGWLVALAIIVQVIGWMLIAIALPRLPALETSVLLLLQPACAMLWGYLLFDERLGPLQLLGSTIVLVGVAVLSLRGSVQKGPASPPIELEPS